MFFTMLIMVAHLQCLTRLIDFGEVVIYLFQSNLHSIWVDTAIPKSLTLTLFDPFALN